MNFYCILAVVSAILTCVFADTPANCTYEDIQGKWLLSEGQRGHNKTVNCSASSFLGPAISTLTVDLYFPYLAVDSNGNEGFWTIVYNQGFEVQINGRKYFAFSMYMQSGSNVTSICSKTLPGWSHDVFDRDWACYVSRKLTPVPLKYHTVQEVRMYTSSSKQLFYKNNHLFINRINKIQNSWTATEYKHFEKMSVEDLMRMAGGRKSRVLSIPKPAPGSQKVMEAASKLPDAFDWRNVNGINYVSPVRNQDKCGSCYAFASMAMNEARIRIMTNNSQQTVFSPQDIVECSEYSQGCGGGFPYLISGKYGEDFGLVEENCNPYKGSDGPCTTDPSCTRHYSTKYEYIGGFYGACNEPLMQINLVKYGPIAVGFEVYSDFINYKGGVYHYTFLKDHFNPFQLTNHAVLVVGYGADPASGEKFWIVKNSWGDTWGEKGFFRIRRGNDECAIESMAVQSFAII